MGQKVAILGASDNPERFSYKAFKMLREYGHETLLVTPKFSEFEGVKAYRTLNDIKTKVDTLTMYVGPAISKNLQEAILQLKPTRVIFNPGTENPELQKALEKAGVHVIEACTLVLLRTNQFLTA